MEWTVIVDFAPTAKAEALFEEWKKQNPETFARLDPEDLRIDTGRGNHGQQIQRYRVRCPSLDLDAN